MLASVALSLIFVLLQLQIHICWSSAGANSSCISYCGNISVSYPFRLSTDPSHCGHTDFELVCQNSSLELYSNDHFKYHVLAINYFNGTIRIVDPDLQKNNCSSIPRHSISYFYEFFAYPRPYYISLYLNHFIYFIKCANAVNSSLYLDTSACSKVKEKVAVYSYVKTGYTRASDLVDSCRVDMIYPVDRIQLPPYENITYLDVHNVLVLGFELDWRSGCCHLSPDHRCVVQNIVLGRCFHDHFKTNKLLEAIRGVSGHLKDFLLNMFDRFHILPKRFVHSLGNYTVIYDFDIYDWRIYAALLLFIFIILALLRLILVICGLSVLVTFLVYKWRRRHLSAYDLIEEFLQNQHNDLMPIRYSYSDLKKITKNFKEKLGEGGYGSIYKGKLRSNHLVAVKILGKSSKSNDKEAKDFINEVATIGRIHHVNVVELIGFCVEGLKRALLYKFMLNGSLDKHIFNREDNNQVSIEKLFEISLGIARGIDYLHQGCTMQILHFDIKPHNILLDETFTPKVADFGLAKLYSPNNSVVSLTAAKGTLGYMAPELFYKNIGGVSYKADVYSYGMLLMEMAGRRRNFNGRTERSSKAFFPLWIHDQYSQGNDMVLLEEDISEEVRKMMKRMFIVALWCIQLNPENRPSMHRVIQMLEGDVESLQMPPTPAFWEEKDVHDPNDQSIIEEEDDDDFTESTGILRDSLNSIGLVISND